MTPPFVPLADNERELLDRAARRPGCAWADLTPALLQEVARTEGIDFATALLYDRIRRSPVHGPFIEHLESLPEGPDEKSPHGATLAIVPGAFHVERPETGADGAFLLEPAARHGYVTERVPLASFGSLWDNARTLRAWLRGRRGGPVVLVSLSKAGAEVKLLLAESDAAETFRDVRAWINLSGLLHGTPLVPWLFARRFRTLLIRLLFRARGYDFEALRELCRGPGQLLDAPLRLPGRLTVIHLLGFPLARHLSCPLAWRGHWRIASLGPNDGGANLLADFCGLPGYLYPVWGADHHLRPGWDVNRLVGRLFRYIGETLRA